MPGTRDTKINKIISPLKENTDLLEVSHITNDDVALSLVLWLAANTK